jgi:cardiolipin synthase (CMP-forming)
MGNQEQKKTDMLNLPNLLSLGRILTIPVFIILLLNQLQGWALITFIVAAISDAADGLLARLLKQRTELGAYLDPAADKLLNASSYITLAIMNLLPSWLAVIVVSRDVIICLGLIILFWTSHPVAIRPSWVSKLTTAFQLCTIIATLIWGALTPAPFILIFLIWATALGTIISGIQYIARGIRIINK